ncbi:MAG: hypothetical protein IPM45_16215 [Acidimicrobiales bacterium]|nr:hypothetical protein [Acidimicrobiales bacterium]
MSDIGATWWLDALDARLRAVPGVVAVGAEDRPSGLVVQVLVRADTPSARRTVRQLAAGRGPLVLEVIVAATG